MKKFTILILLFILMYGSINAQSQTQSYETLKKQAIEKVKQGYIKDAITALNQASQQRSNDYEIYYYRAIAYYYQKQTDNAMADVDKSISLKKENPLAYVLRAKLHPYTQAQKYLADMDLAIKYDPNNAEYWYMRGIKKYNVVADYYDMNGQELVSKSQFAYTIDMCNDLAQAAKLDASLAEKANSYCERFESFIR
ncbi:MAG: hypothetical protein R2798_01465 [Chitinophagales bacterium]|nr:hypothetical protein [Bacteroidota bacterium]MCB9042891.1 hypothetical protein [Chitinophagales bacterium]